MNILIAYGSSEGQTRKIVETIAARLHGLRHIAELFDTASSPVHLRMDAYDKIIVAASVHQKRHQESVEIFVITKLTKVHKPALFISVSLSAAFPEGRADAQGYLEAFVKTTGWSPTCSILVAGALRFDEYDYFKQQIVEHVVLKDHQTNQPKGDYEFTDWASLFQTIDTFVGS
jgi:menaquinone-dependent protoporphyrinogen oxidase